MVSKCKVVFLGAAGVGKTSLINRFMTNDYVKDYSTTVGIDFFTKPVQVGDRSVNLQIWDTAGQERFKSLVPSYIRDSSIAVLVYDVSDAKSFDEALAWHQTVLKERGSDATIILVGNKNDLESKIEHEKVINFARPLSIPSVETSAKTGQNVSRLFRIISDSIPDTSHQIFIPSPIIVPEKENTQGTCSC